MGQYQIPYIEVRLYSSITANNHNIIGIFHKIYFAQKYHAKATALSFLEDLVKQWLLILWKINIEYIFQNHQKDLGMVYYFQFFYIGLKNINYPCIIYLSPGSYAFIYLLKKDHIKNVIAMKQLIWNQEKEQLEIKPDFKMKFKFPPFSPTQIINVKCFTTRSSKYVLVGSRNLETGISELRILGHKSLNLLKLIQFTQTILFDFAIQSNSNILVMSIFTKHKFRLQLWNLKSLKLYKSIRIPTTFYQPYVETDLFLMDNQTLFDNLEVDEEAREVVDQIFMRIEENPITNNILVKHQIIEIYQSYESESQNSRQSSEEESITEFEFIIVDKQLKELIEENYPLCATRDIHFFGCCNKLLYQTETNDYYIEDKSEPIDFL